MRVLVAADSIGALSSQRAGVALAAAWAEQGSEVAVVPIGDAGAGFLTAIAEAEVAEPGLLDLGAGVVGVCVDAGGLLVVAVEPDVAPEVTGVATSSLALGRALALALAARTSPPTTVLLDLAGVAGAHDAGAGLLSGLGVAPVRGDLAAGLDGLRRGVGGIDLAPAIAALGGAELVGVIPERESGQGLLGLRGISSRRFSTGAPDIAAAMAPDSALESFARVVAPEHAGDPSAGACGGAGFAVLALGGRLATGPEVCAGRAGLPATFARADVVVTAVDEFDFLHRGGGVVSYLARLGEDTGVPLIVVADRSYVGLREMRTFGVEAAYALELGDPTEESLAEAVTPIAASWHW